MSNVEQSNQVATLGANKRSVLMDMAARYGMEPAAFEATVRATCSPKGQNAAPLTREEFAAFLLVAREYDLNPLLKEIYAFPTKGGGIQPIVPIDGWTNIINSNPQLDGIEFDDHHGDKKHLTAITCKIWRKDRSRPIVVTEYLDECRRNTEPWKQWPARMLRHKALIQCARYAFGLAGIVDPDEADRIADVSGFRDVNPAPSAPPAPKAPSAPSAPSNGPVIDHETGEVLEDDEPEQEAAAEPEQKAEAEKPKEQPKAEKKPEPKKDEAKAEPKAETTQESGNDNTPIQNPEQVRDFFDECLAAVKKGDAESLSELREQYDDNYASRIPNETQEEIEGLFSKYEEAIAP